MTARFASTACLAAALAVMLFVSALANADPSDGEPGLSDSIAEVARIQQRIADLGAEIQSQQEAVNKALVDVVAAQNDSQYADRQVELSQQDAQLTEAALTGAQRRFDEIAVSLYMRGPSDSMLTATSPDDVLTVATATRALSLSYSQAKEDLLRARAEQVNAQSLAQAASQRAEGAAVQAQSRHDDAVTALTSAQTTFAGQQAELDALTAQLSTARTQLREAQQQIPTFSGPPGAAPTPSAPELERTGTWTYPSEEQAPNQDGLWDTTLPAVPSANVTGDPVAIINAVLQISATSAQITSTMGRQFLTRLGILDAPAAAADTGITNGRIPQVYGRQASEYVIARAMSQVGVPYSWGGGNANGPSRGIDQGANTIGFDCSGLMLYAFAGVGIQLEHYSGSQYTAGRQIPSSQMRRGDLIFYGPNASQHEALYLGNGMMLEAPYTGAQVRVAPVRTSGMTPYVTRLIEW